MTIASEKHVDDITSYQRELKYRIHARKGPILAGRYYLGIFDTKLPTGKSVDNSPYEHSYITSACEGPYTC